MDEGRLKEEVPSGQFAAVTLSGKIPLSEYVVDLFLITLGCWRRKTQVIKRKRKKMRWR